MGIIANTIRVIKSVGRSGAAGINSYWEGVFSKLALTIFLLGWVFICFLAYEETRVDLKDYLEMLEGNSVLRPNDENLSELIVNEEDLNPKSEAKRLFEQGESVDEPPTWENTTPVMSEPNVHKPKFPTHVLFIFIGALFGPPIVGVLIKMWMLWVFKGPQ